MRVGVDDDDGVVICPHYNEINEKTKIINKNKTYKNKTTKVQKQYDVKTLSMYL